MIDFADKRQVALAIQYTNVNPDLTREGLLAHVRTCADYGFHAAMIGPCWVALAKEALKGTGVRVASTVNFPMANDTLAMKLAVVRLLAKEGADEFDFPPNPGLLLGGQEEAYAEELREMARVAHEEGMQIKAMLEFGYITTTPLKIKAAQYAFAAGIDWVKQSSGWGKGGCVATEEDVALLKATVEAPCRVKVSGKVNTLEKMKSLFAAGAELVGTSSGPAIVDGLTGDPNAY
ncbi:deoxyribose-phosphate aldolase [Rhodospirillum rubrum]|uniref:deoxyribose-phosphate aldolase n=1 Tax=Rhodospirillum rubrum TaxID=1085 RepID=UPI0019073919|nr:deoxyribose-phosphate aldolase [Rhodospirillum rubrum]MBK1664310.1 deoxyribose-phosphate aldolase [Rhodospirillum rubrum]MBK1677386.1 deoxyribose-phosphate aldolase [Rhodospirillum rubrum]